jgi:hypothetical protein
MTQGPLEFSSEVDTSSMLNLGAVFLPNIPGLEVHLDLDPRSGVGKSVSLHLNMTIAEVQVLQLQQTKIFGQVCAMQLHQGCGNKKLIAL